MHVYSGYLKDTDKLMRSASGGAATALAESIIDRGGVVFGVRYSPDFHSAEYCCVDNIAAIEQIKGSKYIEADKKDLYSALPKYLQAGRLVLFMGLGCDVAAVRSFCEAKNYNTDNLYTADILCHGPAPKEIYDSYITGLEQKYGAKLQEFSLRYKKDRWTPFYIRAVFDNGKEHIEPFNESDFGRAFYSIALPKCTHCRFKGSNYVGDLCLGDYWGIRPDAPGWNKDGVSAIVVQTEKGSRLLEMIKDNFEINAADEAVFLKGNPMYGSSRKQEADQQAFMEDLKSKGLHYAVSKLPKRRTSIKALIKKVIKKIIK